MASLFGPDGPEGLPQTATYGIYYEIESVMPGPCTDHVPRANRTIVRTRTAFVNVPLWIVGMVGSVSVNPNFGQGAYTALTRIIPESCPIWTPNPLPVEGAIAGQWCMRAEGIDEGAQLDSTDGPGLNPINGWPVPLWQRHRCTFEGVPYAVLSDEAVYLAASDGENAPELYRYIIRSRRPKVREQQIPGGQLFIAGSAVTGAKAPLPPTSGAFIRLASADVQYTWVRVPVDAIPIATLLAAENMINFGVWDTVENGGYSWPDGTLRFSGYDDTDKYQDSTGTWVCDLVLFFEYRNVGIVPAGGGGGFVPSGVPLGWNYYFLPSGPGGGGGLAGHFVGVTFDGLAVNPTGDSANVLYPAIDFNTLFCPQIP